MKQETTPESIKNIAKELIRTTIKIGVPGPLGVAIDEVFYGIGERLRAKRIEKLAEFLELELLRIDSEKLDKEFLYSDEFHDLVLLVIDKTIRSRQDEKIKIFSMILSSSILPKKQTIDDLEDFTEIVSSLTTSDILVLKGFWKKESQLKKEKELSDKPSQFFDLVMAETLKEGLNIPNDDISYSLSKLNSLGLIKEFFAGNTLGMDGGGCYKSTGKLNKLMLLLTTE